jgi:hypothetical protein
MSFNQIIRTFERQGIADSAEIAEYIGFLLYEKQLERKWGKPNSWPRLLWLEIANDVIEELDSLIGDQKLGTFFQQSARFNLLRNTKGEYYPTPHHLATFLATLIVEEKSESQTIYDPTAGTAGLLIAACQLAPTLTPFGTDYNQRWANLGKVNLDLHGYEKENLINQGAIESRADLYDYVLMNPPFASGVVSDLIAYAFERLNETGRAVVLAPSGIVQRHSELLDKHQPEAIITLPPDVLQPHNGIRSHAIVINKQNTDDLIWLCNLESDGYGSGMARQLDLEESPAPSEFPRTQQLIANQRIAEKWKSVEQTDLSHLSLVVERPQHPSGIALRANEAVDWSAFHWPAGALVWTNDTELFSANNRLLIDYAYATSPALIVGTNHDWATILPDAALNNHINAWQIADSDKDEVSITEKVLRIQVGKTTTEFKIGAGAASKACFLDATGRISSPWYHTKKSIDSKINEKGQTLFDLSRNAIGHLMPISSEEQSGSILIVEQPTFQAGATAHHFVVGFVHTASDEKSGTAESGGVWTVKDGTLTIHQGERMATSLRTESGKAQGIAFGPRVENETEGRLFGIGIKRSLLIRKPLEPEQYLPEVKTTVAQQSPAQLLAHIRQNQTALSGRVDWLLQSMASESHNNIATLGRSPMFDAFSSEQAKLLEEIERLENYFHLEDLTSKTLQLSPTEIQQQLDLLVALGHLLPVYQSGINCYRWVQAADVLETEGLEL